jgi:8-oxo-dGTP pyrophosphatase MutT (NUDIX family)/GNAT superfamily N-acetyltransferase
MRVFGSDHGDPLVIGYDAAVQIREARVSDIPAMHEIRLSVQENVLSRPEAVSHQDYERLLTGRGVGFVCEDSGELLGFAMADLEATNIWALFVSPRHERRGAGRLLFERLLDALRRRGLDEVWLSTDPGTRAERFYSSAGWTRAGMTGSGEVRFETRLGAAQPIIERESIRAILLTSANEVLLLRIRPPDGRKSWWITPGGGLEPGETIEEGLKRELQEELGLDDFELGPLVWRRQHTFNWAGKRICQREQYYIVRVAQRFEPRMSDATEAQTLDRFRWWATAELAHASEPLTPLSLAEIVVRYLEQGTPIGPLEVEVLVD